MKAAVYTKTKAGKILELLEVDTPTPKDNEVLIKVRAASVNPLDWRLKAARPGVDVAGEVIAVGERVTRYKPGDAVFGAGKGAFAEYACAPESALTTKPQNLSFEQAASIPIAGLTALQGLRDIGKLKQGQKILINGAAGGIGTFAVQIAKSLGAEVTGVCSTRNADMVRSLGADHVVDYTQNDFARSETRYDLILDNVGNRKLSDFRKIMVPGGRCALAGAGKHIPTILKHLADALVRRFFLRQKFIFFIAKIRKDDLAKLGDLMTTGNRTPVVDKSYPLSDSARAIDYVETGHARAKVVIVP
jgi:NADPH:quinone reductase-like Zn-dependent oxidoreductase